MAWILTGSVWSCSDCPMVFTDVRKLAKHVKNHFQFLNCPDHGCTNEVPRLQNFLDFHLKGEPILGLEYIVERKTKRCFRYTCLLCNRDGAWKMMLTHIIGVRHAETFMARHYPEQAPKPTEYINHFAYVQALTAAYAAVHQSYGGRIIKIHVDNRPFRDGEDVSVLVPEDKPTEETLKRKTEMDSIIPAKQPRSDEISNYLEKFTNVDHYCSLCSESCPSALQLYEHVTGHVHGSKLVSSTPEQLKEFTRMHNFLDTYMKGEPILGLGYVVEKEVKPVYMYTCLLCDVMEDWPRILTHLLKIDHVACYIKRDHRKLSPERGDFNTREDYVEAVIASAMKIHNTLGDKAMAQAASADEDDGDDDPLPPEGNHKPAIPPDNLRFTLPELEMMGVSKYEANTCRFCKLTFPDPIQFCCHLMGAPHKKRVRYLPRELFNRLGNLEYFLNTVLINEPIMGLEYIWMEVSDDQYKYKYTCRLCSTVTDQGHQLLLHCGGRKHIDRYVVKHHGNKSCAVINKKALKSHALEIYRQHGRKQIQRQSKPTQPPAGTEGHVAPSKVQSQQPSTIVGEVTSVQQSPKPDRESDQKNTNPEKRVQPATAAVPVMTAEEDDELIVPQTSQDQETEYAAITPQQELEFRKNEDVFKYLKNFKIQDDKDASAIKQIIQNCTVDIRKYWEEQGKAKDRQGTEPSPP